MNQFRVRAAVSPLRRDVSAAPSVLPTVDDLIATLRPSEPVHCLRPTVMTAAAREFVADFPGDVLYAVKCNPEPAVLRALRALWAGGVRHFDCASAREVALVRSMFADAEIHFMHPAKSRAAIRAAYAQHGVRDFVLDSADELAKIVDETDGAADLGLLVRLAMPSGEAVLDLSGKFGAFEDDAALLLRAARMRAARVGVSFHVGSQCMDPLAYRRALESVGHVIAGAGVAVEMIDVGGGFPVRYPDLDPPPLGAFFAEIEVGLAALGLPGTRLWAEPGRALVAAGGSVVVQVQLRKGDVLYVNDGVYGSLSDAGRLEFQFPSRAVGRDNALMAFAFYGPTCDSADYMRGPFWLPEDIGEGDWIEIGQLGAYGGCLRTGFNGFDRAYLVEVRDLPLQAEALALAA